MVPDFIYLRWIQSYLIDCYRSSVISNIANINISSKFQNILSDKFELINLMVPNNFKDHTLFSLFISIVDTTYIYEISSFKSIKKHLMTHIPYVNFNPEDTNKQSFDEQEKLAYFLLEFYARKFFKPRWIDQSLIGYDISLHEKALFRWGMSVIDSTFIYGTPRFTYFVGSGQFAAAYFAKNRKTLIRLSNVAFGTNITKIEQIQNWKELESALNIYHIRKPQIFSIDDRLCMICFMVDFYSAVISYDQRESPCFDAIADRAKLGLILKKSEIINKAACSCRPNLTNEQGIVLNIDNSDSYINNNAMPKLRFNTENNGDFVNTKAMEEKIQRKMEEKLDEIEKEIIQKVNEKKSYISQFKYLKFKIDINENDMDSNESNALTSKRSQFPDGIGNTRSTAPVSNKNNTSVNNAIEEMLDESTDTLKTDTFEYVANGIEPLNSEKRKHENECRGKVVGNNDTREVSSKIYSTSSKNFQMNEEVYQSLRGSMNKNDKLCDLPNNVFGNNNNMAYKEVEDRAGIVLHGPVEQLNINHFPNEKAILISDKFPYTILNLNDKTKIVVLGNESDDDTTISRLKSVLSNKKSKNKCSSNKKRPFRADLRNNKRICENESYQKNIRNDYINETKSNSATNNVFTFQPRTAEDKLDLCCCNLVTIASSKKPINNVTNDTYVSSVVVSKNVNNNFKQEKVNRKEDSSSDDSDNYVESVLEQVRNRKVHMENIEDELIRKDPADKYRPINKPVFNIKRRFYFERNTKIDSSEDEEDLLLNPQKVIRKESHVCNTKSNLDINNDPLLSLHVKNDIQTHEIFTRQNTIINKRFKRKKQQQNEMSQVHESSLNDDKVMNFLHKSTEPKSVHLSVENSSEEAIDSGEITVTISGKREESSDSEIPFNVIPSNKQTEDEDRMYTVYKGNNDNGDDSKTKDEENNIGKSSVTEDLIDKVDHNLPCDNFNSKIIPEDKTHISASVQDSTTLNGSTENKKLDIDKIISSIKIKDQSSTANLNISEDPLKNSVKENDNLKNNQSNAMYMDVFLPSISSIENKYEDDTDEFIFSAQFEQDELNKRELINIDQSMQKQNEETDKQNIAHISMSNSDKSSYESEESSKQGNLHNDVANQSPSIYNPVLTPSKGTSSAGEKSQKSNSKLSLIVDKMIVGNETSTIQSEEHEGNEKCKEVVQSLSDVMSMSLISGERNNFWDKALDDGFNQEEFLNVEEEGVITMNNNEENNNTDELILTVDLASTDNIILRSNIASEQHESNNPSHNRKELPVLHEVTKEELIEMHKNEKKESVNLPKRVSFTPECSVFTSRKEWLKQLKERRREKRRIEKMNQKKEESHSSPKNKKKLSTKRGSTNKKKEKKSEIDPLESTQILNLSDLTLPTPSLS